MRRGAVAAAIGAMVLGLVGVPAVAASQLGCPQGLTCSVSVSGGARRGPTVDVVGDSITYKSTPYLRHALVDYAYTIRAHEGYTMAQMFPTIEALLATPPRAWVIELGTNDVRTGADWSADYAQETAALQDQACVVLVTVNPRLGDGAATALDADMRATAAADSDVHLVDWGTVEFDNPKWVDADGIHPTPSGSAELARLIRLALRRACR